MRFTLRKIALASYLPMRLAQLALHIRNRRAARNEYQHRRSVDIFDFHTLAAPLPPAPADVVLDNYLYGLGYSLKSFAGFSPETTHLKAYIEHGLFFGSFIHPEEHICPLSRIITFSTVRKQWLRQGGIRRAVDCIGPMIHYAPPLVDGEEELLQSYRRQLGRTLLFFPSHSVREIQVTPRNVGSLIHQIRQLGNGFDSVLISVFWKDFEQMELVQAYLDAGFRVVTSGHKFDPYFLSRQRFLIRLADATASNSVGTHIGYCLYYGKPHRLITSELDENSPTPTAAKLATVGRSTKTDLTYTRETEEVARLFNTTEWLITPAQRAVVNKYWGTDLVKSPEQIRRIIESSRVQFRGL